MLEIIAPYVVSVLTGVGGWYFGKRKNNAEAQLLEIKGLDAIRAFYETALTDTNKQLNKYIIMTENNQTEIGELKGLIQDLLNVIHTNGCSRIGCKDRIIITDALQKYIKNNKYEKSNKASSEEIQS